MGHLRATIILSFSLVLATACVTTAPSKRESMLIYASDETRLALQEAKRYGSLDDGIAALKAHTAKNPRDLKALTILARLNIIKGKLDRAEYYAKLVKKYDYRDRPAKIILANIAYIRGQYPEAHLILTQIGGIQAPEREVLVLLAGVALQQGDDQTSIQLLQEAARRHPKFLAAHMNLGLLYLKHHEFKLARDHFHRALALVPNNADAKLHLGVAEAALGRYSVADEIYQDLYRNSARDPLVTFNLAVLRFRQKNYNASINYLHEYVDEAPSRYLAKQAAMEIINEIQLEYVRKGGRISDEAIEELTDKLKDTEQGDLTLSSFDKSSEIHGAFVFTSVGYISD